MDGGALNSDDYMNAPIYLCVQCSPVYSLALLHGDHISSLSKIIISLKYNVGRAGIVSHALYRFVINVHRKSLKKEASITQPSLRTSLVAKGVLSRSDYFV